MCCGYTAPDRQDWHTVTNCTHSVQLHSYWGGCLVKLEGRVLNFGSRKLTSSVISTGDTCVVTKDDGKITVDWVGSKTLLAIDKFEHVSAGKSTVLLTSGLTLHYLTSEQHLQLKLEYPGPLSVTMVAVGADFALVLGSCGIVWSWGNNNHGQLGLGDLTTTSEPTPVDALCGLNVVRVSAGNWHSAAVTQYQDLYCWGWNNDGQLGLPKEVTVETLPVLLFDCDISVRDVQCGARHTAVLTTDNDLIIWGYNKYGQCAGEVEPPIITASESGEKSGVGEDKGVQQSKLKNVEQMWCGPWSTYAMVKD